VYGELQNLADPYRNVIGIFSNQLLSGRPMTIFGDGLQTRAFTHIDDVAPVIARSIDVAAAANEVFNVGADTPYTVLDLAHAVANAFGVTEPEIEFLPARKEVVHAFSDHTKLHGVFGRQATVPLDEGLSRMARWTREAGVREPIRFESVEVLRNLPPSWAAGLKQTA
jgi:UDP-glucose 4-epimerase